MEVPKNQRSIDAIAATDRRQRFRVTGAPGLILEVSPGGEKVYFVRYSIGKGRLGRRQVWHRLGPADIIRVAEAAEAARQVAANALLNSRDAVAEQRASTETMQWLFDEWSERHGKQLKGWPEEERRWNKDIAPTLGPKLVTELTRADVALLRDRIAKRSEHMADRAVGLVVRLLNWAVDAGRLEANPALHLRKVQRERKEGRVIPLHELRVFLEGLPTAPLHEHTKTILTLLALLGQRRTEVAHMRAEEVRGDLWTIPRERTKNGREHVVPLPPLAAAIVLRAAKRGLVFETARGSPSPRAITRAMLRVTALRGIGPYSPHDLRRTMTTEMARLGVPKEVRDRVLNHTDQTVEGVHYNKYEYLVDKYRALSIWAEALGS